MINFSLEHFKSINEQIEKKDKNTSTVFIITKTPSVYQLSKLSAAVLVRGQRLFQSNGKIILLDSEINVFSTFWGNVQFFNPWKCQGTSFLGSKQMEHCFGWIKKTSVISLKCESQKECFKKTTHAKLSEKQTFLTPWYAHVRTHRRK